MSETCFSRLSEGGQLLVWSMRHWMVALVRNQRVPDNVIRSLDSLGDASLFGAITALVLLASPAKIRLTTLLRLRPPPVSSSVAARWSGGPSTSDRQPTFSGPLGAGGL